LGIGSSVLWVARSFGQLVSHLVGASDNRVDDDKFGLYFDGRGTSEEDNDNDDEGRRVLWLFGVGWLFSAGSSVSVCLFIDWSVALQLFGIGRVYAVGWSFDLSLGPLMTTKI
jgi:hypothetical protein